ncbi:MULTISPECIES: 2-C-methyl-D-erythritol 4-phosphate cytidylyltransferase [unclassified Streptococcus]|uniref:2-C-methyl-D-erythritol 4-phosphate cytidylyltransferase n=1 Tax=unclassified Streptococcus TaxID=2608887 RepID=UPI001071CB1C|nr:MULTISPECIES: 2-C-methyl-D-erythritol 4-phosphate cytidylyltransferase [unclassified Streptococcus]MBF0805683.1 2-C-methyl-D-erythritol 4-phosphate cytidylyltransferase [Streptococcus sp. 19428wA2_WM07]TFU28771.1 2-C-methyl-D-erythritol 4-phosphate cytidylyltransferase [Streptococcus sp. WM07]
MNYDVILLVAGSGSRMMADRNKILLELEGQPIFSYSLKVFQADLDCQRIILVGRPEDRPAFEPYLSSRVVFVTGGAERQDSVRLGLEQVEAEWVMVHDGARPFICLDQLQELKAQPNSILAVPVKDTIKEVAAGMIQQTVPRERLMAAQTPQFFERALLVDVHEQALQAGYLGTDDASLVEAFSSVQVALLQGSYWNVKMTTPEDLILGQAIRKEIFK